MNLPSCGIYCVHHHKPLNQQNRENAASRVAVGNSDSATCMLPARTKKVHTGMQKVHENFSPSPVQKRQNFCTVHPSATSRGHTSAANTSSSGMPRSVTCVGHSNSTYSTRANANATTPRAPADNACKPPMPLPGSATVTLLLALSCAAAALDTLTAAPASGVPVTPAGAGAAIPGGGAAATAPSGETANVGAATSMKGVAPVALQVALALATFVICCGRISLSLGTCRAAAGVDVRCRHGSVLHARPEAFFDPCSSLWNAE